MTVLKYFKKLTGTLALYCLHYVYMIEKIISDALLFK